MDENGWQSDFRDLQRRLLTLEERMALHTEHLINAASDRARREVFSEFGVNSDDPIALQDFRQSLLFAKNVHRGINKALGAAILAMFGAIGSAVTLWLMGHFRGQ